MPTYVYKCKNQHKTQVIHGVFDSFSVACPECGKLMWRVPQIPNVIWEAGLPPHLEHTRPARVQSFIDTEERRRDAYVEAKEIYNNEKERIENGN